MNALKIKRKVTTVVLAVVLVCGMSAFSLKRFAKHSSPKTVFYFQYSGTDAETDYENKDNWSFLSSGLPGSDPCPGANNIVCVLNTSDISTGTTTALTDYLKSLTPVGSGAANYCHTAARMSYQKP